MARADDAAAPAFVGRVSALAGSVQYRGSTGDWSDALINEPVAAGIGLRSSHDAETELRIAGARIALAPSSELRIVRADRDALQIAVIQGRIGVHLDRSDAAQTLEIDLPHGAAWLDTPGDYDIVADDASTPAHIGLFTGTVRVGGGLEESRIGAAEADAFNDWWRYQSDTAARADAAPLTPNIAGATALDANGRWEADSTYGNVWYPSDVADDWTPYRDGVWRYLSPWGWTWVDAAPWGFAPSHYGRWVRVHDRWAWVPGPQRSAPDYSPAVVAFLGTAGIGLSRPGDTGPAVAWFPLSVGETIGDGGEANYQNRRFATAVPRAVFAGGHPVASALVDMPEQRLADAPVILQALDIPPASAAPVVVAVKKPAVLAVAAVTRLVAAHPIAVARQAIVTRLHEAFVRAAHKRVTVVAAAPPRPRPAPTASAMHTPPHGRRHLAALHSGA